MPYRRLPNTNQARLRALSRVVETGTRDDGAYCLAVPTLLEQARMMLPQYERKMSDYHQCFATQGGQPARLAWPEARQARMYVSHFIQVLNMWFAAWRNKCPSQATVRIDP